jgi:tetratricopeptide (TPR) repeat protein
MLRSLALCACLGLSPLLLAEDALPTLIVVPHDTLVASDGEPLLGKIQEVRPDGTVVFLELGKESPIGYKPSQFRSYSFARTAEQVVTDRLAILEQRTDQPNTPFEVLATLRWGAEEGIGERIDDESLRKALLLPKSEPLAEYALERLRAAGNRGEDIERLSRAVLAEIPGWERGHDALMTVLLERGDQVALRAAVEACLAIKRNNHLANKLMADFALAEGDLVTAREAYRKASTRNDADALLGYGRLSLDVGDRNSARRAAESLLATGSHQGQALAILGSIKLAEGQSQEARRDLQQAVDAGIDGPLGDLAVHNLGVARYRAGDRRAATALWRRGGHPASRVALAIAERRPVPRGEARGNKDLQSMLAELQAVVALESGDSSDEAVGDNLDPATNPRHKFLDQVRRMLASGGEETTIRALAFTKGRESLRWQAYGHIIAGRYDEAWTLLEQLPEDDGYAAVYRVYVKAAQGEDEGAASIYRQQVSPLVNGETTPSVAPPIDFVATLDAEFSTASGEFRRFEFDWRDGDVLGPGWDKSATGTGIRIHVANDQLVFEGTQRRDSAISRAWCRVRQDSFQRVVLDADFSSIATARAGLEILDTGRQNGVAVTVGADRRLRWRQISGGRPGPWQDFVPQQVLPEGRPFTLLYQGSGRVALPDNDPKPPNEPFRVGEPFETDSHLTISIFGEADAGTAWRFAAQRLDLGRAN